MATTPRPSTDSIAPVEEPPANPTTPISPTNSLVQSSPPRPELHIDTTPAISHTHAPSITPSRTRDTSQPQLDSHPLSSSASLRSQRSDLHRVRFSSDVQTLGERGMSSPSISAEEALARLRHSTSQTSLNRPTVSVAPQEQIRGILRTGSTTSSVFGGQPSLGGEHARRSGRPRGWSLRRQLFSRQEQGEIAPATETIDLDSIPMNIVQSTERPRSRVVEDVDAIEVIHATVEQTKDESVSDFSSRSSTSKKLPAIEAEVTRASLPFYSMWATSQSTRHFLTEKCKGVMRKIKRLRDPRLISKGKGRVIPIDIPERGKVRLIDERTGREYVDNLITSSRYTVASFLPRQLWAQFSKIANLYEPLLL
jgi:phospholipid-translocating ATPase